MRRKETPEQRRARYLRFRDRERAAARAGGSGLTPEEVAEHVERAAGRCEVCGAVPPPGRDGRPGLYLDHHHASGVVRGLVCVRCNLDLHVIDKILVNPERHQALLAFALRFRR